jgi:hypothetical protein
VSKLRATGTGHLPRDFTGFRRLAADFCIPFCTAMPAGDATRKGLFSGVFQQLFLVPLLQVGGPVL